MDTLLLENYSTTESVIQYVHGIGQPVVIGNGTDECLIAMTPENFERILFDTALLNLTDREALRF